MLYPSYIRRNDPLALMRSMMRDADRTFAPSRTQGAFPAINMWQSDDAVAITAELPGIDPSGIEITVKDNILTVAGERAAPDVPEGARWHRNERAFGKFSRSIRLPYAAADDRLEARFQDGVLRILVGRPEQEKPRKIEIKAA